MIDGCKKSALALALVFSSIGTSMQAGSHLGYPEPLHKFFFNSSVAYWLSQGCPRVQFSEHRYSRSLDATVDLLESKGVTIGRIRHYLNHQPIDLIERDMWAFLERNGVDANAESTDAQISCNVAANEINKKTEIGKLLKVVK